MAQMSPRTQRSESEEEEEEEEAPVSVDDWLQEVSKQLDPTESEDLAELGIYSIHDGDSARTVTLPVGAEMFEDATTVKQYYYAGEKCPLLIIAPLTF